MTNATLNGKLKARNVILLAVCLFATAVLAATTTYTAADGGRTWSYTLDKSGNATLTGVDDASGAMTLPSVLDGHAVTSVGEWAFSGKTMSDVVIPDSVTTLNKGAFANCTGLGSVKIGNGVVTVCGAPDGSRNNYPDHAENFKNCGCFYRCTALTNIVFGTAVKTIARGAFYGCTALRRH